MNKKKYGNYIAIGLTALAVIAASILIFFLMYKINTVRSMLSGLVGILMPFIIGGVIAYLLTPIYNWLCRNLDYYLCVKLKRKSGRKVSKGLAVLLSILLAIGVVSGLIALVVPELISSIMGLVDSVPSYLDEVGQWLDRFLVDYGFSDGGIQAAYDSFSGDFQRCHYGTYRAGCRARRNEGGEQRRGRRDGGDGNGQPFEENRLRGKRFHENRDY